MLIISAVLISLTSIIDWGFFCSVRQIAKGYQSYSMHITRIKVDKTVSLPALCICIVIHHIHTFICKNQVY